MKPSNHFQIEDNCCGAYKVATALWAFKDSPITHWQISRCYILMAGTTVPGEISQFPVKILQSAHKLKTAFISILNRSFYRIGLFIGARPYHFFIFTLSISLLTLGIFQLNFSQCLQDGFVSRYSQARIEHDIKVKFDGIDTTAVQRFVALVRRKDRGSLLGREELRRVLEVKKYINEEILVTKDDTSYSHSQLCEDYCESNKLLEIFEKCVDDLYHNENVLIDHPKSLCGDFTIPIGIHIFGITRKDHEPSKQSPYTGEDVFIPYNSEHTYPVESNGTNLKSISMVALYFVAPIGDIDILSQWESKVFYWSQWQQDFPELRIDVMGDKILSQEMVRGGLSLGPFLGFGFLCTITFVTAVVMMTAVGTRYNLGSVIIIFGIVASPVLAVCSTFGFMGLIGSDIYPTHMVIPFLILAIGVDDAFLMLHAWNRILPQYSHLIQKNKKTALSEAFAKVLQEIGPSIKITSLTNALAFSITIFFSTPAMESFCIAAFVAIILDFIFEITLFGSSLVISGKFYKVPKYSPEKKSCRSWSLQYSRFLTKKSTRIGVILLSFGFLLISLYGTLTIETKIDSQRIIPYDSPLRESDKLFKEYYWKEHELIEIFVTSPPNISNPEEFSEFQRMMNEFHDLPRAIGSTSTVLFLDDYIKVDKAYLTILYLFGGEFPYSYDELPDFLGTRAGLLYNHTVRWHENEQGQTVVDAFKFYTGFHNATTWMERAENMLNWRRVASRWSQFNVTVYSENAAVFEGIFNMASQTSLSATSTLICMIVVCFLFVPSLVGVVMAAFAIASISLGVVGFLSLTGLALDPVTMSAIVMSIGFSVDYTAHISYHFQSAWNVQLTSASSTDCLHHTISAVASPMLQAAASTIACFIPVAFHPDCTPTVFIRTIFLVVTFGVLHGLLILPTLLAMLPRRYFVFDTSSSPSIYRQARSSLLVEKKSVEPSEPFHSGVVTLLPEIESSKSSQETMESLISPTESES